MYGKKYGILCDKRNVELVAYSLQQVILLQDFIPWREYEVHLCKFLKTEDGREFTAEIV